ncbi:MAG: beta-lactamase family protein [Methyloglobulus sp.]|nr:beta-lactamase family protein [Methyloglobulus sp.]
MKAQISLLLGLVFLLSGCASTPPIKPDTIQPDDYSYLKTYLTWLIEDQMAGQEVEGLSIAVVDDQHVVWAQGFGYADTANKTPATPETIYRAGSISKLFTDTLVMQLAGQGKLDIDKPLQTYLPDFSIKSRFTNAAPITPRNIMTHHSGLPGDVGRGMWTKNPAPFNQLVSQLKDEYVAYAPNTIWSYSNLGITLLGAMLQETTGEDFNHYAERQLLKPLGMNRAAFSSGIEGKFAAKAYKNHEEKREVPLRDTPAGGLNANVLDMSQFMKMVFADGKANGRQILKPETLKEMLRPQNKAVALDAGFQIGLGWMLRNNQSIGTIAEHGGATLYHRSQLSVLPQHKLGVIVSTNSPPTGDLLSKLTNTALKLALAIKAGKQIPIDDDQPAITTRSLNAQEQILGAGQYATSAGYVKLTPEGDSLTTEVDGHSIDLVARDDGNYGIRYKLLGLFAIEPDELTQFSLSLKNILGHDLALGHYQNQSFVFGEKIKPVPISQSWRNRLGQYEIINLTQGEALVPEKCALKEQDGFLMLEYSIPTFDINNLSLPIAPASDKEATILGQGRGMQETVRIVNVEGKDFIAYSGYLLRKKQD